MTDKIQAYWFAASDRLPHGDNRKIIVGEKHSLKGEIVLCRHALHWSRHPIDALSYARGPFLYKVNAWGNIVEEDDKGGSRHREYVAMRDATIMLRRFAREQASSVIHLWKPPEVVRQYLESGEETLREAARAAAMAAAREAAWEAARAAAREAAWEAAREAARAAARAAAKKRFSEMVDELFAGNAP